MPITGISNKRHCHAITTLPPKKTLGSIPEDCFLALSEYFEVIDLLKLQRVNRRCYHWVNSEFLANFKLSKIPYELRLETLFASFQLPLPPEKVSLLNRTRKIQVYFKSYRQIELEAPLNPVETLFLRSAKLGCVRRLHTLFSFHYYEKEEAVTELDSLYIKRALQRICVALAKDSYFKEALDLFRFESVFDYGEALILIAKYIERDLTLGKNLKSSEAHLRQIDEKIKEIKRIFPETVKIPSYQSSLRRVFDTLYRVQKEAYGIYPKKT